MNINHSPTFIEVVIAVISRGNNILISKRKKDGHLGGLWEFPGGKTEANETALQTLHRELDEELGITVIQAQPLMTIPCHYPEISVMLNVWQVTGFTGRAFGKEQQQVKWVSKAELPQFEFPDINKNIINALKLPNSYVITKDTDLSTDSNRQEFIKSFRKKCKQSYQLIQLRIKNKINDNFIKEIISIAHSYQIKLQINSSLLGNITFETQDDKDLGIHLTSIDLMQASKSKLEQIKEKFSGLISASCHTNDDILKANTLNLDFIVISPVNKTTSHPDAQPLGWDGLSDLVKLAQMPVYALGGMTLADIELTEQYGIQGIAGISCFDF